MAKAVAFKGAKKAHRKRAKRADKIVEKNRACGFPIVSEDGDIGACPARGDYTETYRWGTDGSAEGTYHIVGTCSEGHKIERYGYAVREVA